MDYIFLHPNTNKRVEKEVKEIVKEVVKFNKTKEKIKKVNDYKKSKNPSFVWVNPKPKQYYTLDEMIEGFIKESKDRGRVKTVFISNHDQTILDIKKSKNRKAHEKEY
ncbi:MAG TPA: hypothetical protein VIK86_05650 [Candidatus Paceibacterota bacterium]